MSGARLAATLWSNAAEMQRSAMDNRMSSWCYNILYASFKIFILVVHTAQEVHSTCMFCSVLEFGPVPTSHMHVQVQQEKIIRESRFQGGRKSALNGM